MGIAIYSKLILRWQ